VQSALDVPKNTFDQGQVLIVGVVHVETNLVIHVETNLLQDVCDVRTGESQLLENTNKTSICRRISH
jgi:hypothetical protein